MAQNVSSLLLLVLAIIGAIALVLLLGSWLFHGSMMSGGMMSGMTGGMDGAAWVLGFFIVAGAVALVALLARRQA